jgi:protocatechuate 3,4-dioxygenase beta subunit
VPPREIDRRRALTLLGAGVGAIALAACGSDNNDSQATPSTGGSPSTTTSGAGTGSTATTAARSSGAASTTLSASSFAGAASCTATPAQTEGPYYIDVDKIRGDIREDRPGTRLRVGVLVLDVDGCTPVKDAIFEIWHCDAGGLYSGFEAASTGGRPGGGSSQSDTTRYLRGAQITNGVGIAEITTIYPGWYQGRTVHIHAKVILSNKELLTTQLYFDDTLTNTVYASAPYNTHTGSRTLNTKDGIYRKETTLTVSKDGDGYLGLITIGVQA